ncbi:MAG: energy transducer TonB [Hyphomonadaceae bacterium]|nr:energy transducer TonB [Hyphomonadaceae bacterium]
MTQGVLALDTAAVPRVSRRVLSLSAAAAVCAMLAYLAMTQNFGVVADLIDDGPIVTAEVEPPRAPPVTPPTVRPPPSPPQRATAPDPTAPPTETSSVVSFEAQPPAQFGQSLITNPSFLERPSGRDFERYFPRRALTRGESGRVVLDCAVAADGRLSCAVASEEPLGWGFGDASLQAARHFRVAPATADGRPTSGGRLRVPMVWRAQ